MTIYKHVSTKEYVDAFPIVYRHWTGDPADQYKETTCRNLKGYSLTIRLFFGANELDARSWVVDYGSLRPLKVQFEKWFDHALLVAEDDPQREILEGLGRSGLAKITFVKATGCEALAQFIHEYVNTIFMPTYMGDEASERIWCYRVEVRETQSNMAFFEAHRGEYDE